MNRLELGKYWLARLCRMMPQASVRMVTRLAWHLAALSVRSDSDLAKLTDTALTQGAGGSRHFISLRDQYLRRVSAKAAPDNGVRTAHGTAGSAGRSPPPQVQSRRVPVA